ncbi:MAG: class I SAM-dependent methyltransferase [Chloroflexi bacterium]|nr:class I SAM-dependent methyltransferase [Chloroflexota bacterium]
MDTLRYQIEYYRARAVEYDEWFYRIGRYDQGQALNQQWFDEAAICMENLHSLGPVNTALELAAGTGIWTRELHKIADHITVLDSSPESLDINREKLGNPDNVTFQEADLFNWEPDSQYDLVSFTFWLSHVPPDEVDPFLAKVYRATKPGGKVWMVDSRKASTSTASNQSVETRDVLQTRSLNDGRVFEIVKIYYQPDELREIFERNGFSVEVHTTNTYFIYAIATR